MNIDLSTGTDLNFVLINLFKEALAKFGKSDKLVKSIEYNVVDGLTVVDEKDVVWKLEVNAKAILPESLKDLPNHIVSDEDTKCFCVDCNRGINPPYRGLCSVCEYLNKI